MMGYFYWMRTGLSCGERCRPLLVAKISRACAIALKMSDPLALRPQIKARMEILIVKQMVSNQDYHFAKKRRPLRYIFPAIKFSKVTATNQKLDPPQFIRSVWV